MELGRAGMSRFQKAKTIWIDLDNSPHVPFFFPIIKELEGKGHRVVITVRDTFQVVGLADHYKVKYKKVGKHYGANKFMKVIGTAWRSVQLAAAILGSKPDVSISHGSRSLILLSSVIGIPTILLFDYEFSRHLPLIKPIIGIGPEVINSPGIAKSFQRGLRVYSGIKEDVYVPSFEPDPSILSQLNIRDSEVLVTIRPPASEAHYHNPESDRLFVNVVEFLGNQQNVRMIILPRNEKKQRDLVLKAWPQWCEEKKIIIPDRVVDGLNLIWHSDLVISGGGTMNREAAALGVPVYSIFRGTIGAVDRYLTEKGRLVLIESDQDVQKKIRVAKRIRERDEQFGNAQVLKEVMSAIEEIIEDEPRAHSGNA
jgi:predicted glycosyltransferase